MLLRADESVVQRPQGGLIRSIPIQKDRFNGLYVPMKTRSLSPALKQHEAFLLTNYQNLTLSSTQARRGAPGEKNVALCAGAFPA